MITSASTKDATAASASADLLRYLTGRLGDALDNREGDNAVAILAQIRVLDSVFAENLLNGLLRIGMRRLIDHLTDAVSRRDGDTVLATLANIRAIDPTVASDLTNHLEAAGMTRLTEACGATA
jgi:hypothetical protein